MRSDPRYQQQWLRHERPMEAGEVAPLSVEQYAVPGMTAMMAAAQRAAERAKKGKPPAGPIDNGLKQDWGTSLNAGGKSGDGMYPAKFTFDATAEPSCPNDYVAFNTSLAGGAAASGTGTFTESSISGTATVNGVQFTADPGVAATQSTTVSSNNIAAGNTITINGTSSVVLTASAPVAQVSRLADSDPVIGETITIAGIIYEYHATGWTAGTVTAGRCWIVGTNDNTLATARLAAAISIGSANTGSSTSTWECSATGSQPSNGVNVTGSTQPNVDVTAKIAGSTGVSITRTGSPVTISTTTAGSDGSAVAPNFQYWSGAAAATAAQVATNIAAAVGTSSGVTATNPSSGVVVLTAPSGALGNGFTVSTTIPSGLTGAAFSGNLSGGVAGVTAGTTFSTSTESATAATNHAAEAAALAGLINANVSGVSATSSLGVVTITATTRGTSGNSIGTTETFASGFVFGGTTLGGGTALQPSIIAYNNLYSTDAVVPNGLCGGSGPSVKWAYDTGTGTAVTSPILSLDGTKIIYVQTSASGAILRILQLNSGGEGSLGLPIIPANVSNWASCSSGSSCLISVPFTNSAQAANSSPFYDYTPGSDTLYVGDDTGILHKFSPVLTGTPAEVTTGGWPVDVDNTAATALNSPVREPGGKIFVTSTNKVCSVTGTTPTCTTALANGAFTDGVIIDGSTNKVFAFSSLNAATVHQYDVSSFASPVTTPIADAADTDANPVFTGAFNHDYLTSANGTGKLFVLGKSLANANRAALYRISITAGAMSSTADSVSPLTTGGVLLAGGDAPGSPVTSFYNPTTGMDWIFFAVSDRSTAAMRCPTQDIGCLGSYNVTGTEWPPTDTLLTAGYTTPDAGNGDATQQSTGGIVVDNTGGSTTVPKTTLASAITPVTALAAAVNNTQACIRVTSSTGFTNGDLIQIAATPTVAAENMTITGFGVTATCTTGTVIQVSRSAPIAHVTALAVSKATTTVVSATGFSVNDFVQVDAETMQITSIVGTTFTLLRGALSTTVATHLNGTAMVDLRTTLLNGAINNSTTSITVDSTTTFNVDDYIQIDNEAMKISAKTATTLTVSRTQLGSSAATHADNSTVTNLSKYPQAASIYTTFGLNASSAAPCNGATGVGCAIKLTQATLR
jgi:hypothetical protein